MLDSDLAKLYNVETKRINEAVKRNLDKFPERFSWILTNEELNSFEVANCDLKLEFGFGGRRYNPRVFTEQGVAMLATILRSKVAKIVSISIIDAFVSMRHYLSDDYLNQKYYKDMIIRHDSEIKLLQESFNKLHEKKKYSEIYFNGQIYDAYSKILDIFKEAKREIIIIDSYADKNVLDIIKRLKIGVIIITKANNLLTKQDISKYNKQYHNLEVVYDNTFHDRYFILDKKKVYHCGASINRIGYKTFSITEISDKDLGSLLISKIKV